MNAATLLRADARRILFRRDGGCYARPINCSTGGLQEANNCTCVLGAGKEKTR